MHLQSQRYGKQRVRVLRLRREAGGRDSVSEITASVLLEGDFAAAYLTSSNHQIVATDTIKNTVHVLAYRHLRDSLEEFALTLGDHFLGQYPQVEKARIEIEAQPWQRMEGPTGEPQAAAFVGGGRGVPCTCLEVTRSGGLLQSGLRDLLLMKTTDSAFRGFPRCELTTLPETDERILATNLSATWTYQDLRHDFEKINRLVVSALLETFAREFSPSVQHTLFLMGTAALNVAPALREIRLSMPNKHYLPIDLQPFGLTNAHELFLPTDEPHGQIEAVVTREKSP